MSLAMRTKRTLALAATAAGSSVLTSSILDMQGFESVIFETYVGGLTTGQTKGVLQVNAGNVANGSDMAALAGATITVNDADTGKLEVIEVVKPTNFRYVEIVFTRNTQAAAVNGIVAVQAYSHRPPENDDATTVAQTLVSVDPEYASSALTVTTAAYGNSTTQVSTTSRNSS